MSLEAANTTQLHVILSCSLACQHEGVWISRSTTVMVAETVPANVLTPIHWLLISCRANQAFGNDSLCVYLLLPQFGSRLPPRPRGGSLKISVVQLLVRVRLYAVGCKIATFFWFRSIASLPPSSRRIPISRSYLCERRQLPVYVLPISSPKFRSSHHFLVISVVQDDRLLFI